MNQLDAILNFLMMALKKHIRPRGVKLLTLIGLLVVASKSHKALKAFFRTFFTSPRNLTKRYGLGSWALITGGAQGIGGAFAKELAARGFNLILIDINVELLTLTSQAISTKFPMIEIKTITCNFANSWQPGFFNDIMQQIEGLDISMLINNVGTGFPPGPFHIAGDETSILGTMAVNMVPTTILSKKLIPQMLQRSHRSGIINVSSNTGIHPVKRLAVYSSTKAYVDFLSRAMEKDLKHKIDVISVRPDAVSTQLIRFPTIGSYVIPPEAVAKSVLRRIGNEAYCHGHWKHEVRGWFIDNEYLREKGAIHFYTHVLKLPYDKF